MTSIDLTRARDAAERAADAAAHIIATLLDADDWQVRYKADASPVTDVDVAAERAIRAVLRDAFPEAALDGEELGNDGVQASGSPALVWRIDPIDGTKSFVRRLPYWSTQIALEVDGELVVGVSNAPAFGERMVAVRGAGVTLDGRSVGASQVGSLDAAFLSSGNLASLARDAERWARFGTLVARVARTRGYGDFTHYHQLCSGGCDLVIESDVNILDIAALSVAIREAGGVITDLQGAAVDAATTSVLAACTAELHAQALAALTGAQASG